MPFLLTCDHCGATLRTANAVATGRQVACPKCKNTFAVSANNCQEEGAPKPVAPAWEVLDDEPASMPKAVDKSKSGLTRKKVELAKEEDDRPSRRKRRYEEEDDEDDRPRRKKSNKGAGTSGNKVALIAGGGVLLVALIGAGIFFATRGNRAGSGSSSDGTNPTGNETRFNTRPKREIPKELLAYYPSTKYSLHIEFNNFVGSTRAPSVPKELVEVGVTPEMIEYDVNYFQSGGSSVTAYSLRKPIELDKAAQTAKWIELKAAAGNSYRTSKDSTVVFQPKSTVLVVLRQFGSRDPDVRLTEELLVRKPGDSNIPDGLWSLMQEVSGYEIIKGRESSSLLSGNSDGFRYQFWVEGIATGEAHNEILSCWECASESEARKGERIYRERFASLPSNSYLRSAEFQVVGNRLYQFARQPRKDR